MIKNELFNTKIALCRAVAISGLLFVVIASPLSAQQKLSATASPSASDRSPGFAHDGQVNSLEQQKASLKANVEMWEERVRRGLTRFNELAKSVDLRKIEPQQAAISQLRETLNELDLGAQELLRAYADLGPNLHLYRQALEQGPTVFTRIAEDLDRKAMAKKSPTLKEAYADFSAQARTLAATFAQRAKGMDGLEAEIRGKIAFVEESREFIADAQGFLAAIPNEGGVEVERLVKRLNTYIGLFEETLKALRTLGDKISEPKAADSAKELSAAGRPNGAMPRTGKIASTLSEYQRRLEADKK